MSQDVAIITPYEGEFYLNITQARTCCPLMLETFLVENPETLDLDYKMFLSEAEAQEALNHFLELENKAKKRGFYSYQVSGTLNTQNGMYDLTLSKQLSGWGLQADNWDILGYGQFSELNITKLLSHFNVLEEGQAYKDIQQFVILNVTSRLNEIPDAV